MELEPPQDHIAGALDADGCFSGRLKQYGCRYDHLIKFIGRLDGDRLHAEFFTSANGNPPELAARKIRCTLPIRDEGRFGASDGEEYRYWLRYRPSGGPKYQWLCGQLFADRLFVRLIFGSPKYQSSFCRAEGWFVRAERRGG
ncbi:hypothetical protein [Marinobacterium arenosum]|uniref:hypothetical protein n=1 Tax=Marinobacterium arenosum TaxID=2862496 RepID=UPI001C98D78C|nr:hypothetical protein [Marinobacterium arenosum]MBY4678981.1 hypothetical protein [Marinobacterium arenosum]